MSHDPAQGICHIQPPNPGGKSWEEEYQRIVDVLPHEALEEYVEGGFHPVALDDTFNQGRYTVRYKLGFGGYSTVWLAKDNAEDQWVSLKIKKAKVSHAVLDDDSEIKFLRSLEEKYVQDRFSEDSPLSFKWFPSLLDSFQHNGPNGSHTCIVTKFLGPSLTVLLTAYNHWEVNNMFPPDVILRASRQLLQAVNFSHQNGIVHGGNMVWTCDDVCGDDEESMLEALGGCKPWATDYTGPSPRPVNLPKHLVALPTWNGWYNSPDEDIRLVDWGESFAMTDTPSSLAQPASLQSPETYFVGSFNHRHDLWRVGCVIYYLFFQNGPSGYPFSGYEQIDGLRQKFGPLPAEWNEKWTEITDTAPRKGLRTLLPFSQTFEPRRQEIIAHDEAKTDVDKEPWVQEDYEALRCLYGVIEGLTRHRPEDRISAVQALDMIDWVDHWREYDSGSESIENSGSES